MKKQTGITLIALVVTIIVLLILAGITMNIVLNEGGIIAKAQSSKEKQEVAAMLDRLTVAEANTAVNYFAVDMEKYNAQLKAEGIANNSNYKLNADGKTYTLITGEYSFIVSEPTPGDIVINYEGKVDALKPRIIKFESTENTSNAIKVQVEVERLEEGNKKVTYQYKKQSETNYITLKENVAELTADYINLEQNQIYDLKVIAENRNGSSEMVISVVTGGIAEGTISQKGTTVWSNGKASVELQTTDTTNTMQYQKNDITGTWTNYTGAITGLIYQDRIYARMWDGTNGNSPFSLEILDKTNPIINEESSATITDSVTLIVDASDNESGLKAKPTYTFYRKLSTEIDSCYIKEQETTSNSYTKTGLTQNTSYTIKVEVKDNAENIGTYIKNLETQKIGGADNGLITGNIVASTPVWNSNQASITLSTTTGLNIEWQKNSIVGTWTKGTSVTGLVHNDVVYARLTDGTNYGDSASITIIDNVPPQNATISLSKTKTQINTAITATVTQSDNQSGLKIDSCKWVYNTTSSLIGNNEASYTGGSFTSNSQTISLNTSTAGTYYLHILTTDMADNKKETVSTGVIVEDLFNISKGVNVPKLGSGMTPIKWNGSTWVNTTPDDSGWYDYNSKQWANAMTADGSYWVWIPRYAYQIASGYHAANAGTINIKFLKGLTNVAADGTSSWNNTTGSGNWNIHPAFTYNTTISGIWVAKFEASFVGATTDKANSEYNGTNKTLQVKPGVSSWRKNTIGNFYTVCMNYNTTLKSHLIKNMEWGAVAYLAQSSYGKNAEIWVNNSGTFITGSAGNGANATDNVGTTNIYYSSQGMQASTTGNVYGIYDMAGGSGEYTAGYVNNGDATLTRYASALYYGASYTKDVYNVGSPDDSQPNAIANSSKYGDALYETCNGSGDYTYSWYAEASIFPSTACPFFAIGLNYKYNVNSGIYCRNGSYGGESSWTSFRPVLCVD